MKAAAAAVDALNDPAARKQGTRTLSPCDAIFFYYTAILWTGLREVLAAVRLDG
jgi:hypothetical protein